MKKAISVLGATGSIGRQTLDVMDKMGFRAAALTADTNTELLEKQARRFHPELAVMANESAARDLAVRLRDTEIRVLSGEKGLLEAASLESAGTVITGIVGIAGLKPTMAAVRAGKRIGLANKETLVCAGSLVMRAAKESGAEIIPVDSEHSAIFQSLRGGRREEVERILLTASGGPFRGRTFEELASVTKEAALKHPNWHMGPKVTIDSATMMNKGLEIIEAMHLFGLRPEQIQVLVHPQSIVHSMVEFRDHAVIAQLGAPDMRIPIAFALTYPERGSFGAESLDFAELPPLTFEKPDLNAFRCLRLAMETAGKPGAACAVMNGANETAVGLFLAGRLSFNGIYEVNAAAVEKLSALGAESMEEIIAADREARALARDLAACVHP